MQDIEVVQVARAVQHYRVPVELIIDVSAEADLEAYQQLQRAVGAAILQLQDVGGDGYRIAELRPL